MVCSKFAVSGPGCFFFWGGGGPGNETKKLNCLKSRQSVHQTVLSSRLIKCTMDPTNQNYSLKLQLRRADSRFSFPGSFLLRFFFTSSTSPRWFVLRQNTKTT